MKVFLGKMPWESTNVRLHSPAGDKLPLADAAIPGKPRWDGDWAGSSLPVLPHAVFIEAAINAGLLIMPCSPHSCLLTLHLVQEPSPCWASRWSLSSMALEVLQGESSAAACSRSPRQGTASPPRSERAFPYFPTSMPVPAKGQLIPGLAAQFSHHTKHEMFLWFLAWAKVPLAHW